MYTVRYVLYVCMYVCVCVCMRVQEHQGGEQEQVKKSATSQHASVGIAEEVER